MKKRISYHVIGLYIIVAVLGIPKHSQSQLVSHHFENIDSLQKIEERTLIVFIHADWCKFCEQMKIATFQDEDLISKLNNNFYFISFDGESEKDIVFAGKKFKYAPSGNGTGVHELAAELGTIKGKTSISCDLLLEQKERNIISAQSISFRK